MNSTKFPLIHVDVRDRDETSSSKRLDRITHELEKEVLHERLEKNACEKTALEAAVHRLEGRDDNVIS